MTDEVLDLVESSGGDRAALETSWKWNEFAASCKQWARDQANGIPETIEGGEENSTGEEEQDQEQVEQEEEVTNGPQATSRSRSKSSGSSRSQDAHRSDDRCISFVNVLFELLLTPHPLSQLRRRGTQSARSRRRYQRSQRSRVS